MEKRIAPTLIEVYKRNFIFNIYGFMVKLTKPCELSKENRR